MTDVELTKRVAALHSSLRRPILRAALGAAMRREVERALPRILEDVRETFGSYYRELPREAVIIATPAKCYVVCTVNRSINQFYRIGQWRGKLARKEPTVPARRWRDLPDAIFNKRPCKTTVVVTNFERGVRAAWQKHYSRSPVHSAAFLKDVRDAM